MFLLSGIKRLIISKLYTRIGCNVTVAVALLVVISVFDSLCKVWSSKTEDIKKLISRTAVTESIVYTNLSNLYRTLGTCYLTNSITETTDNVVLFDCDDSACFLSGFDDDISVDWLDCVDVDKTSVDALLFKLFASL